MSSPYRACRYTKGQKRGIVLYHIVCCPPYDVGVFGQQLCRDEGEIVGQLFVAAPLQGHLEQLVGGACQVEAECLERRSHLFRMPARLSFGSGAGLWMTQPACAEEEGAAVGTFVFPLSVQAFDDGQCRIEQGVHDAVASLYVGCQLSRRAVGYESAADDEHGGTVRECYGIVVREGRAGIGEAVAVTCLTALQEACLIAVGLFVGCGIGLRRCHRHAARQRSPCRHDTEVPGHGEGVRK